MTTSTYTPIYLRFDEANETFCYGNVEARDVVFTSYCDIGYRHAKIEIPTSSFYFHIHTNFGYGNKAVLNVDFKYKDIPLVNFYDWMNTHKPKENTNDFIFFRIEPHHSNWEKLFDVIKSTYEQRNCWNYNSIENGIKQLESKIKKPFSIPIIEKPWNNKEYILSWPISIFHIYRKTAQILQALELTHLTDVKSFNSKLIQICDTILPLSKEAYSKLSDSSSEIHRYLILELEDNFDQIYSYLKTQKQFSILISKLATPYFSVDN